MKWYDKVLLYFCLIVMGFFAGRLVESIAQRQNREEQIKATAEIEKYRLNIPFVVMPGKKGKEK